MDLASVLSQAASQDIVLGTIAREDVCGKVSERGHRLHSLSRHLLVTLSRRLSSSYLPVFAYQIAYALDTNRTTITIKMKAYNMLCLSQEKNGADSPQAKEFRLPLKEHRGMLRQRQALREAQT